jgi:hypothetical protein
LNIQSNGNNELSPLVIDIPYFENNIYNNDKNTTNSKENKINDKTNKIRNNFSYLNKFSYINNNNIIKRYFFLHKFKKTTMKQSIRNYPVYLIYMVVLIQFKVFYAHFMT